MKEHTARGYILILISLFISVSNADTPNPASMDIVADPRQPLLPQVQSSSPQTTGDFLKSIGLKIQSEKKPESDNPSWAAEQKNQLLFAVGDDNVQEMKRLISAGADINSDLTGDGMTPLMLAQSPEMVNLLIQQGANVNQKDSKMATALLYLLFSDQAEQILPLLLNNGADVNAVASGMNNETPILAARQLFYEGRDFKRAERVVRILHNGGANINAQDAEGYTLLITAAVNNKLRLAQLMIALGANIEIRSKEGMTALDYAKQMKHEEIVDLLINTGAN